MPLVKLQSSEMVESDCFAYTVIICGRAGSPGSTLHHFSLIKLRHLESKTPMLLIPVLSQ